MSDQSIVYRPRLLAEAVRTLLDASPSDDIPGLPAGNLTVARAWAPVYQLTATGETVLSVLCGDDSGNLISRGGVRDGEVEIAVSLQKLISQNYTTNEGKAEIDEVADLAERCLDAAFNTVTDANGRKYVPLRFQRTMLDETLVHWNQVSLVFSITYKAVS